MPTVIVTQYKKLEYLPPVMALLTVLKDLGHHVIYVGVHSEVGEAFFRRQDIEFRFMPGYNHALYHGGSITRSISNRIRRALAFYGHRQWMRKMLLDFHRQYSDCVLWQSEVMSAALIGDWGLRFKRRILSIYELADFQGSSWWGFHLRRHLGRVRIVVPECNRAHILKEYFRLAELPLVLPNKPAEHPRERNLPLPNRKIEEVFDKVGNRPVFLYQGVWSQDRKDVALVLETIARNRPGYCIVTMPVCDAVVGLSKKYPNVFGLPYVAPPDHLTVTSHATVGIAIYNSSGKRLLERLNAVYCAPNKIFEYAGFGIPTLGNKLPGLVNTIANASAGRCCLMTERDILLAADDLVAHGDTYAARAGEYYDSVDIIKIVKQILEDFV